MDMSTRKVTEREAERLFKRYHEVLAERGRTCSCCIEKLDAVAVEKAYLEARRIAEKGTTK